MRNLMSVNISLLCVITKRGTEGGNDIIQCPYDRGFETHQKYLSKGIWADRVDVIRTQTHRHPAVTHKGRFSLYDDTERRVFSVTITNLVPEDSGTYWCEINTWRWYHKTEVRITVDRDRTNGTVGATASPTDITRTQGVMMFSGIVLGVVLLLLGLLLFMFFRQRRDRDRRPTDPDTGTITNPIYATATNQNPDTACDITTIHTNATNPRRDDIHFNVGPSTEVSDNVTYATVNFPRDPSCLHYATVNFPRDPACLHCATVNFPRDPACLHYATVNFPRDPACLHYATVNFPRDPS
ncbi:CMRF35-like molecule 8 isoform X3 [Oncorhynchus masou masou]|uniref:CMRF35-like molecule 8 isoform X3 n=1 Tax=Oncorhynchus masou masou TaxID=90313 RepID=UPI0031843B26